MDLFICFVLKFTASRILTHVTELPSFNAVFTEQFPWNPSLASAINCMHLLLETNLNGAHNYNQISQNVFSILLFCLKVS